MILIVDFHLYHGARKLPISSKYRPDWISLAKPQLNGGSLCFLTCPSLKLFSGETVLGAMLVPLANRDWFDVNVNDCLFAYEGPNDVGVARVIKVSKMKI